MVHEIKLPFCECGCGEKVTKPGNKFINAHGCCGRKQSPEHIAKRVRSREETKLNPKPNPEPQLCKCGCGELTKPGNDYIHGHNGYWQGKKRGPMADNHKLSISKGLEGHAVSEETRSKISNGHKLNPQTGNDIIEHHMIYDHSDLSKNIMKMTRSMHMKLHQLFRKYEIEIPHINIKE